MKEVRGRALGIDGALDRFIYGRRLKSKRPKDRFLALADLAPWRENDDLGFVTDAERTAIIAKADEACRHEFDLLGSGVVHLGEDIDWHLDFKSGHRWDATPPHARINWAEAPSGADVKVPWELSRCMHFATLGLADRLSGDCRYYEEFKAQVRHWIRSNPVGHGINWFCAMDVALRVVNWINASMLFSHRIGGDSDDEFFAELDEALWMAGLHISRNLEWKGPKSELLGNHFVSDLIGLLSLGLFFGSRGAGRRWYGFAKRWLELEILRQVYPDGSSYETSTSYHRLVMEMYLWSNSFCKAADDPFSEDHAGRLHAMADFVLAYSGPSGRAAQFGDNDSGRVLTCGIGDPGDHRYLLAGEAAFGGCVDRWLLCGGNAPVPSVAGGEGSFPDGGYWFMRTSDAWLGVRAGVVSHNGAHAHCDQMSFVMSVAGVDIIIDPGTGVYSADSVKRNRYRSTGSHNSCRINDWEANSFREGKAGLFRMADDTKTEVLEWKRDEEGAAIVGKHRGFERHRSGVCYERSLKLSPGCLVIRDQIGGLEPGDQLDWMFRFAPGVEIVQEGDVVVALPRSERIRIAAEPGIKLEIVESDYSPAYGVEQRVAALKMSVCSSKAGTGSYTIRIEWGGSASANA